jgi:hypothetical protein
MKLAFQKSARLQRFLNQPHSAPVRLFWGVLAAIITFVATRERPLAAESYRRFAKENDFKLGFRRLSWYLRRRWDGLQLSNDRVFVFTHALQVRELIALRRFVHNRATRADHAMWLCDLAYVSASLALHGTDHQQFATDADAILAALPKVIIATTTVSRRKDTFSIADAEQAIRDFADAFPYQQTPWYVISGTFLGLVRENGFLRHDTDIDLGLTLGDVDLPVFLTALYGDRRFFVHGEETQTTVDPGEKGGWVTRRHRVLIKVAHRNGTHIDVFLHHRDGDVIWHGSTLFRWDNTAFDLIPYPFCGTTVLGPADADRYLTENYGNWRVPVKEFSSAVDTTNQRVVRNPLSVAIFLRRAMLAASSGPAAQANLLKTVKDSGFLTGEGTTSAPYRFNATLFGPPSA